jgi:hypothetical protein
MNTVPVYQSDNRQLNQSQNETRKAIENLSSSPLSSGQIVSGVDLKSGSNDVGHGLGKAPTGYIVVAASNDAKIYWSSDKTNSRILTLISDQDVKVNIFVF